MDTNELITLFSQALAVNCNVVVEGNFCKVEITEPGQVSEIFLQDCKDFLSKYGIETVIETVNDPQQLRRAISVIQIEKLDSETFEEKLARLNKAVDLHVAAQSGDIKTLKLLLDQGIDVNTTDIHGETPLFNAVLSAAYMDNFPAIKLLLEKRVNINHPDNNGENVFDIAVREGDPPLGKKLIDAVLEKDPTTEKPGFNLSELNDYWDEKVREMEETPVAHAAVEEATGGSEVAPTIVSRLQNVGFFPANQESSNGEENRTKETPAVANLGK